MVLLRSKTVLVSDDCVQRPDMGTAHCTVGFSRQSDAPQLKVPLLANPGDSSVRECELQRPLQIGIVGAVLLGSLWFLQVRVLLVVSRKTLVLEAAEQEADTDNVYYVAKGVHRDKSAPVAEPGVHQARHGPFQIPRILSHQDALHGLVLGISEGLKYQKHESCQVCVEPLLLLSTDFAFPDGVLPPSLLLVLVERRGYEALYRSGDLRAWWHQRH
mmetsp:Transcript_13052/g.25588  ORF Transcript_13052/g.25588 Transcript_13052/m.25588 type:complete len:216 (-) Transcript_13052:417-1064(-)